MILEKDTTMCVRQSRWESVTPWFLGDRETPLFLIEKREDMVLERKMPWFLIEMLQCVSGGEGYATAIEGKRDTTVEIERGHIS